MVDERILRNARTSAGPSCNFLELRVRLARRLLPVGLTVASILVAVSPASAEPPIPRGPFKHETRSVRSRDFDVGHIRLELALDWDRQQVTGRAAHTVVPFRPVDEIELDAEKMSIDRVVLVNSTSGRERELEFEALDTTLKIDLGREHPADEALTVAVEYRVVEPTRGLHFVLPDEREPDQQRSVWTQSEPELAHLWFPCYDSPNDRATSEMLATVPEGFFALSNGELKEKRDNGDGTWTWVWSQDQTHVAYLITLVAGEFEALEQSWDGIPIASYVPPGRLADAERSFGKTAAMMQFYSERIGYRYPWPKYAQICVDEYTAGGMEHTSATTLTLRTLHDERAHLDVSSDNLVAHELVHHWWGDLLTCKDWGELWLNESFATYFATLWAEHDLGWDEATWQRVEEANDYFGEDQKRYRRPIVTYQYNDPSNMFDRHTYPKGGRVLHMLRYVMGDDLFWRSIRHYVHKHAYGVVESADLRVAVEEAAGGGLNWFFDQWIDHGGHPEYDVRYTWDESQGLLRLTVKQTQKVDQLTPLFRMPVEIELVTDSGAFTREITVSKAEETFQLDLPERPRRVVFDPRDWILKKLVFHKSKPEWIDQLLYDVNVVPRAQAAEALAEYKPDEDALAALVQAAMEDRFWAVRKTAVESLAKFSGDRVRIALVDRAQRDSKSFVRRAACKALSDFPHDDTSLALRNTIADDPSYFVVADALRTLAEVDGDRARDDLLAVLDRSSHQEVVLQAACDGLAELKDASAIPMLVEMLDPPSPYGRRVAVLKGLAKLGAADPDVTAAIATQLTDDRLTVRRAAIEALGSTGDPGAIDLLLEHRNSEPSARALVGIDDAVEELRSATSVDQLRKQLRDLDQKNRALQDRIEQIEKRL